jgi:TRAP-type mannitol/chloroaromatic compound transport system permease small subunit
VMALVALAIFISMLASAADALGGRLLNRPVPGAVEGATNLMAVIVFGSLAYVQRQRGHVRVELLYSNAGPRIRALLDVFNDLVVITFFGLLAWQAWDFAMSSYRIGEAASGIVRFPLYPAKFVIFGGSILLILQMTVDLAGHVTDAIRGEEPDGGDDPVGGLAGDADAGDARSEEDR